MKKVLMVAGLALLAQMALAGTYDIIPPDHDMYDLDHYKAYEWGFELEVPEGEEIVGASLFFNDIRNWDNSPNDLWVTLVDSDFTGINIYRDDQGGGAYFAGQGLLLEHYEDLPSSAQDIIYYFDGAEVDQLAANLVDDMAGIAFDPDCHFYNCGIKLTIETDTGGGEEPPIPEPLAASLLVAGLGSLGLRRRR